MTRDQRLRVALIRALITEPDRKLAGEILDRWDELIEKEKKP